MLAQAHFGSSVWFTAILTRGFLKTTRIWNNKFKHKREYETIPVYVESASLANSSELDI
jgi:hypothetical protein